MGNVISYDSSFIIFKLQDKDSKQKNAGEFYQVNPNSDPKIVNILSLQFELEVYILSQKYDSSIIKFIGYSFGCFKNKIYPIIISSI